MGKLNFEGLAELLLLRIREILPSWLPGGKVVGREYVTSNLMGGSGDSLKINLATGVGKDFATGETFGDLIELHAKIQRIGLGEAAKELADRYQFELGERKKATAIARQDELKLGPAPADAAHPGTGTVYRMGDGRVAFEIVRREFGDGKKTFTPWTYSHAENQFVPKAFPAPRPILGLDQIDKRPTVPVLLVEGEKAQAAAAKLLGHVYFVTTWAGGAQAWKKTDFAPLAGRRILLWPDADDAGRIAMSEIAQSLFGAASEIKVLDTYDLPKGQDAADFDFTTYQDWLAWAKPRASAFVPDPAKQEAAQIEHDAPVELKLVPNWKPSQISQYLAGALTSALLYDEYRSAWFRYDKIWRMATRGAIYRVIMGLFDRDIPGFKRDDLTSTESILAARLGRSENGGAADPWNKDKSLLPLANGVLNIDTMAMRPHRADDMFNWILPYDFDPTANCPVTERFIKSLAQDDPEMEKTLYAFLAALVHGRADLQKYLELVGLPGTGKSTFLKVAQWLVGDENTASTNMDALQSRFETSTFFGKRLIVIADSSNFLAKVDIFKSITGCDPIRYEEKNIQTGKPFIFGGLVIVAANSPIQFDDKSTAMMRRRVPIHIDRRLTEAQRDIHIDGKLQAELPGLLNLLLTFSQREIEDQLNKASSPAGLASRRSLVETNPVAEWLDEHVVFDSSASTKVGAIHRKDFSTIENSDSQLYPNFIAWSEATGKRGQISHRNFSRTVMEILGVVDIKAEHYPRHRGGSRVFGIRLRSKYDSGPSLILQAPIEDLDPKLI